MGRRAHRLTEQCTTLWSVVRGLLRVYRAGEGWRGMKRVAEICGGLYGVAEGCRLPGRTGEGSVGWSVCGRRDQGWQAPLSVVHLATCLAPPDPIPPADRPTNRSLPSPLSIPATLHSPLPPTSLFLPLQAPRPQCTWLCTLHHLPQGLLLMPKRNRSGQRPSHNSLRSRSPLTPAGLAQPTDQGAEAGQRYHRDPCRSCASRGHLSFIARPKTAGSLFRLSLIKPLGAMNGLQGM